MSRPAMLSDALASIGPVGYKHINFRGIYRFPVERHGARLLASAKKALADYKKAIGEAEHRIAPRLS